jgi:hypothetical protein
MDEVIVEEFGGDIRIGFACMEEMAKTPGQG